jgi:autotransporter-associated beta strand protein
VKSGPSILTISNANSFSGGTVMDGGRIVFGNKAANSSALGTGSVQLGGAATLELFGASAGDIDGAGVGALTNALTIAEGETATFLAPFRYTLGSTLTGDGTFNLRVNGVRGDVTGNFSAFTGRINVTSLGGTTDFRVANIAGFPFAQLNLASGVLMYSRTTGGATIPIGEFSASAGAIISAGMGGGASAQNDVTWRVGDLNTDVTNAASFQGTTKLIKQGTGAWTLTGNSTHNGATIVSNGTLIVSGTLAASPVVVASNAMLTGTGILGGGATVLPAGNFVPRGDMILSNKLSLLSANCFFNLSSSPAGANDQIALRAGLLSLTNTQNFFIEPTDGFLGEGTYVLIDGATNTISSGLAFASNLPIGSRQDFSITAPPGQVLLNVTGSVASLVWRGTNSSTWDNATTNWLNAGSADKFWPNDAVTFDDSSTNGAVALVGSVRPRAVLVTNTSRAFVFDGGSLDGSTTIVKSGSGSLTLSATNNYAGGTKLIGGTLMLGSTAANASALGTNAVTLDGGTLQIYGYGLSSTPSYGTFANDLIINSSGTLKVPPRATIASRLTGSGTLNLVDDYVRADFTGDWSTFTGQINVVPRSGGSEFRLANSFGYGAASIYLSNGITAYPTGDGVEVEIGELSGAPNSVLGPGNGSGTDPTWIVGGKNTSATFAGSIRDAGITTVIKTGSGTWTLSGSNTFSGGVIVSNGTLLVSNSTGSGTGSGAVEVQPGAKLGGNGTIAGVVTIEADATLSPGTVIGKLTLNNTLTLGADSTTYIEVNKSTATNDSVICNGTIHFDGNLIVTNLAGTLTAGDSFTVFTAAGYSGDFAEITGSPGAGMTWSFNPTNGILSVISVVAPPPSQFAATVSFPGYARAEVLTNIPLLVVLGTNIPGFSYAQFIGANAGDLRFTTTNGETELNYEVDTWNPAGISRVWVQLPTLTSNTVVRASWGNSVATNAPAGSTNGATWGAGYVGVWHLADSIASDSTAGAHAAILNSSALTNGLIGNAAFFNGTSSAIQVPWSGDFNLASNFEVQGWFKVTAAEKPAVNNFLTLTSKEATANSANRNWWISMRSDGRIWWKSSPSIDVTNGTDLADGAWHHFAAVHDGTAARLYLDGAPVATDATPGVADTQTAPLFFGAEDGTPRYHRGLLEELRVSDTSRSSNWVWAVYQNIASNSTFNSISAVSGIVTNPPTAPTFDSFAMIGGQPTFTIGGAPGYNYTIQGSTNLVTWINLVTTNPGVMPFLWTDSSTTNFQRRFYRTLVSP